MNTLDIFIDWETRSRCDLVTRGADNYIHDASTEAQCLVWAIGDGPINLWAPHMGIEPLRPLFEAIADPRARVIAHNNGGFDEPIWTVVAREKYGFPFIPFDKIHDSAAFVAAMGLPGSLDHSSRAIGLPTVKDEKGYRTMMYLCKPVNPTTGEFCEPWDAPCLFQELYAYAKQDIVVMRNLVKKVRPLSDRERKIWELDQKINRRGVSLDMEAVFAIKAAVEKEAERLQTELQEVTGNAVPSVGSHVRFKAFLASNGIKTDSVDKAAVTALLATNLPPHVRRALEIRREAAKSSTAKYTSMVNAQRNGRVRNMFHYHAATQTARWGGRLVQLHNLPRPKIKHKEQLECIELFKQGKLEEIGMLYGSVMSVAADCIRPVIIPAKGKKFIVADFSNIEGRGLAWLAGETWKVQAYEAYDEIVGFDLETQKPIRGGPDSYKLTYSRSFHIDLEKVTDDERQVGKVMELAFGYQGSLGAFLTMAKSYGVTLPDERIKELVTAWRNAHPKVVKYWYEVERAAINAMKNPGTTFMVGTGAATVSYTRRGSFLCCRLPSSRVMYYPFPELWKQVWVKLKGAKEFSKTFQGKTVDDAVTAAQKYAKENKLEIISVGDDVSDCLTYMSIDSETKKWVRCTTYGGSMVENLTQGICRDVLADAMLRLEAKGYELVMHVHDEAVAEVPDTNDFTVREFEAIMSEVPEWAKGFPIAAAGWEGYRYRKG